MTETNFKTDVGFQEKTYNRKGQRTFYLEGGDPSRPTVILLHGHATTNFTWRQQYLPLAERFHVIAPDLIGYGRSSKPKDASYIPPLWVEQIMSFADDLGYQRATYIGNSLGALIAAQIADLDAKRVEALILIAAAGAANALQSLVVNLPFVMMRLPGVGRMLFDSLIRRDLVEWNIRNRLYANPQAVTPEVIDHYVHVLFEAENREIVFRTMKNFGELLMTDDMIKRIQHPTLLLWGESDTFVPASRGKQIHKIMPNSELEIIAGASHCPHEDRPEIANTRMLTFLSRIYPDLFAS